MLLASSTLLSSFAQAQQTRQRAAYEPRGKDAHRQAKTSAMVVRVALSKTANKRLFALRMRHLLSLELDAEARVASRPSGPLGEDVIRVWIDVPNARRALIEVRRGGRSLARQKLAIGNFPSDVAARVVAIAAAEMVRVQARIAERSSATEPRLPWHADDAVAPLATRAAGELFWLASSKAGPLSGPSFAVEHRRGKTAIGLGARWLVGDDGGAPLRWFDLAAEASHRWSLSRQWRLRLGGRAATAWLSTASTASTARGSSDWTATVAVTSAIESRLDDNAWLALSVAPTGLLRSVGGFGADSGDLEGASLTVGLELLGAWWPPPPARNRSTLR